MGITAMGMWQLRFKQLQCVQLTLSSKTMWLHWPVTCGC